jgi:gliding motility associated protien GldN
MLKPFGMKAIFKITLFFMLPLMGFAQGEGVRFTDKFGPFHDAYQQENDFTNRKFVAYPYIREADVFKSWITWEIIDLRQKVNLPLYYPTDTLHNRRSYINALLDGITNNQFNAFKTPLKNNAFEFDPNNIYLGIQDVRNIGMREESIPIEVRPGVFRDSTVTIRWRAEEIKQILIKEVWYFSRKDSKMHNEIIGVCPIREYTYNGMMRRQRLFWIYYPDTRSYLSTIPVFNPQNDKPLYSFDDMFVFRYFNSYFVQEANVYNDRLITDYVIGREAQLESDRIKHDIFDFEQDLWEN